MGPRSSSTGKSNRAAGQTDRDAIISDLYDGVMDEVAWRRALAGIARSVGGEGPSLLSFNPATGQCLRSEAPGYLARSRMSSTTIGCTKTYVSPRVFRYRCSSCTRKQ